MPSTSSSVTLSFGGVDFILQPQSPGSELSFVNGKTSDEVVLNLTNFSGSLVVSLTSKELKQRIVEEEPNSPTGAAPQKISPRQQQLNFSSSSAKKNQNDVDFTTVR